MTIKTSHIQYPTIFWLNQKIKNQQMIAPLKKKKKHLNLKSGMREDSFFFKKCVFRAVKKLAFIKQLIKITVWIVQEGRRTSGGMGCGINQTWLPLLHQRLGSTFF